MVNLRHFQGKVKVAGGSLRTLVPPSCKVEEGFTYTFTVDLDSKMATDNIVPNKEGEEGDEEVEMKD